MLYKLRPQFHKSDHYTLMAAHCILDIGLYNREYIFDMIQRAVPPMPIGRTPRCLLNAMRRQRSSLDKLCARI